MKIVDYVQDGGNYREKVTYVDRAKYENALPALRQAIEKAYEQNLREGKPRLQSVAYVQEGDNFYGNVVCVVSNEENDNHIAELAQAIEGGLYLTTNQPNRIKCGITKTATWFR